MIIYDVKQVSSLTEYDKAFYYINNKRVSYKQCAILCDSADRMDCFSTVIKGDKVTQFKTVYHK